MAYLIRVSSIFCNRYRGPTPSCMKVVEIGYHSMKSQVLSSGIANHIDDDDIQVNFEFAKNAGYDLVLERATNIVKAITERNFAKVLHIHCGGRLVDHFGQVGLIICRVFLVQFI